VRHPKTIRECAARRARGAVTAPKTPGYRELAPRGTAEKLIIFCRLNEGIEITRREIKRCVAARTLGPNAGHGAKC